MRVITSGSNYSFVSSQLEAVKEGDSGEIHQKSDHDDDVHADHDRNDYSDLARNGTSVGERTPMMNNTEESGRIENRQRDGGYMKQSRSLLAGMTLFRGSNGNRKRQMHQSGKNEEGSKEPASGGGFTTKLGNGVEKLQKNIQVQDGERSSCGFGSNQQSIFTTRKLRIRSTCLPRKLKLSRKKLRRAVDNGFEKSLVDASDNTATNQSIWDKSASTNTTSVEEEEIIGSRPLSNNTEVTIVVQDTLAGTRGSLQAEDAASEELSKNGIETGANKMSHSVSSPALSTAAAQGKTRRESSPAALHKTSHQTERRQSKFSQITSQARRKISQAQTTSSSDTMCTASVKRMKQTQRTLRMFTCVVVVFAVCMLPNQITWIWMAFNGAHLNHVIYTVFYFLTYTNSVINPWIYGVVNPSFRNAYRQVFCCRPNSDLTRNNQTRSSSKLTYLRFSRRGSEITKN